MSDAEARGFLATICANPADDLPRLVYADWLDEHGDAPRAEFIRAQVERATLPDWDAWHLRLRLTEQALLAQHRRAWRAELPAIKGVAWGEFRRGFVAQATLGNFGVFRSGAAAFEAAPIEAVHVRWPRRGDSEGAMAPVPGLRELSTVGRLVDADDLERLADSPVLETLRTLTVADAAIGSDGFRRLMMSPHLRNLTALRVPYNSIGNAGIEAVIAGTLPSLAELDLSEPDSYARYAEDPAIDESGMAMLASWPGLAGLRALMLSGSDLRRGGLRELLQSPHAAGLKRLAVRGNALTGDAMREFAAATPGLQLETLDLGENSLRAAGAGHLAGAACLGGLKTLHVDRCELGPVAVRKLAKAPFLAGLRALKLGDNAVGPKGLAALLKANPPELHTLALSNCDLGEAGVAALGASPASDTLLQVDLSEWGRGNAVAPTLGATPHLRSLLALRLLDYGMDRKAAAALLASPLGERLAVLETHQASKGVLRLEAGTPPLDPDDDIPF